MEILLLRKQYSVAHPYKISRSHPAPRDQYAMWDNVDGSMVIRRPLLNYRVSYDLAHLCQVEGKTRTMPDEFINENANGVTEKFYTYCRSLVGSGFPESHRLRAPHMPEIKDV
jgi:6-phosphofructokinase 1